MSITFSLSSILASFVPVDLSDNFVIPIMRLIEKSQEDKKKLNDEPAVVKSLLFHVTDISEGSLLSNIT